MTQHTYPTRFSLSSWGIVLAILVLFGIAAALPHHAAYAQEPAQVPTPPVYNVAPTKGIPSTRFSFYATGFNDTEHVAFWFNDPNGNTIGKTSYVVKAWQGRADWTWSAPSDAPTGYWSAVAKGLESNVVHTIQFEVIQPGQQGAASLQPQPAAPPAALPASSPDTTVTPSNGAPGTTFAFGAGGYHPGEQVRYWTTDPNGQYYDSSQYVAGVSDEGRADWSWTAPADATPGTWQLVARGQTSGVEKTIFFAIDGGAAPQPAGQPIPPGALVNPPDVGVEPAQAYPNTKIAFFAAGYQGNDTIHYWAIDPNGIEHRGDDNKTHANEQGRADWEWKSPDAAAPGVWTMMVWGEHTQREQRIYFMIVNPDAPLPPSPIVSQPPASGPATPPPADAPAPAAPAPAPSFDPSALPPNPPDVGVEPAVASPDTNVAFFVAGYPARETVRYWAIDPNGTVFDNPDGNKAHATDEGRADWRWKVPDNPTPGVWTMVAFGDHNHIERQIFFFVENPDAPGLAPALPTGSTVSPVPPENVAPVPPGTRPTNPPNTGLEPAVGPPDYEFAFYVAELPPRETLFYWVVGPNGMEYREDDEYKVHANVEGRADWTWRTPTGGPAGIWTMVTWGEHSNIETRIYFEVVIPEQP